MEPKEKVMKPEKQKERIMRAKKGKKERDWPVTDT